MSTQLDQIKALAAQGVRLKDAEAVIGRAFTPEEVTAFRKTATLRRLKRAADAQEAARRRRAEIEAIEKENVARWLAGTSPLAAQLPKSALERQHAHRMRGRELGDLPRVRHRRVRERYRYDLLGFGLTFGPGVYEGMKPLLKRPPSPKMIRFVLHLQDKILHGGLKHVRWPRGKGKSTWVKIAVIWAMLYGHKFFVVVVEKTKGMAQVVVEEIWKRIYLSPRISADFPEFAVAMRDVELSPQRMRSQTYNGKPTYMKQDIAKFCYYKLPTLDGFPNTGGIIAFRGADQALRGINIESARPDFFFIDDPQTDEEAKNPASCDKIENNINGAVLGSGETNERISAVMASTPIEPDDVSERFADPKRHPEWYTDTEKLVTTFGPAELISEYLRRAEIDEDSVHSWYLEHRAEIEAGVEMMDDSDFVEGVECSAYEHALYLLHTMKPTKFYSEFQMAPTRSQGIYKISPKTVRERVNGVPFAVVPSRCDQGALAFVDINESAGLRWEICAFGHGRVAAVVAYGQYPAEGVRLFPKGVPESAISSYLAPAIRKVAEVIQAVDLKDETGAPVKVRGICFDGGWQTECVAATVAELKAAGISAAWSKGYSSKDYSPYHHERAASGKVDGVKAAEKCHTWITANGVYLAFNSDYWKEVSQTSFLAEPLSPSSSSFYGIDPLIHFQFAQEVCNEELKAKDKSQKYGYVYTWHKDRSRPNHYGDVHAGALAFGAIRGNFDPVAKVVDADALKKIAKQRRKVRYVYSAS